MDSTRMYLLCLHVAPIHRSYSSPDIQSFRTIVFAARRLAFGSCAITRLRNWLWAQPRGARRLAAILCLFYLLKDELGGKFSKNLKSSQVRRGGPEDLQLSLGTWNRDILLTTIQGGTGSLGSRQKMLKACWWCLMDLQPTVMFIRSFHQKLGSLQNTEFSKPLKVQWANPHLQ